MNNVKPIKQPLRKWESISNQFFWLLLLSLPDRYGIAAKKIQLSLSRVVLRVAQTIRVVNKTLNTNHRLYFAVIFMLVMAPLTNVGYQFFDESVRVEGQYYVNAYYLLYVLSPWISLLMFSTGLFLLFPANCKRSYFLVIPITSAIVKILWLSQIQNNEEFHQIVPMYFILPASLIAFVWIFCVDWLMARKYHKLDGIIARIEGLINIKADHEVIESQVKELKNFQSNY